ncbi:exported hypothetical protein [Syntrophobacter sp. SbD1]|nr:exported hypothetical protein [Syntrophobacter sp. SbD1]
MRMSKAVAGFVAISAFMAFGAVWAAEGASMLGAHASRTGGIGQTRNRADQGYPPDC